MTENELRAKVVSIARQYLGCKESNGSHKKIIDGYNAVKPLARGYAVKYTDAWCATYVSFVGIKAGLTDIMFRECGCGAMIQLYKNAGRWVENDAYVPKIGDIVMYYWNDSGYGDCTGYPDHVGIVESINGNTMRIIEGNINNSVGYRTLYVNGRYIRGYCIPNYASKVKSESSATNTTRPPVTPSVPTGSTSSSSSSLSKVVQWDGYVNASELNVRTWAGIDNPTCSFSPLNRGTVVGVCDSVKDKNGLVWYYIKYNNKYGFVSSEYVKKQASSTPSTSTQTNKALNKTVQWNGYVTASALNVRTWAGTNNKKCSFSPLKKNTKVGICDSVKDSTGLTWYYIKYNDKYGFVSSKYVRK